MLVPPSFAERIIKMRGVDGKAWLHSIPVIIKFCEERWTLKLLQPKELNFNFVTPSDDGKVVVKICQQQIEFRSELEALRYYNGRGFCRLVDFNVENRVLLLQALRPGIDLFLQDDDHAVRSACSVIKEMEMVSETITAFPDALDWMNNVVQNRMPDNLKVHAIKAQMIASELVSTQTQSRLLHGDLHHGNILQHEEGWKAIDPKGVMGETAFEVIPFLLNNVNEEDLELSTDRRVVEFSRSLKLDQRRIFGWGLCRAILSVWWNVEDNLEVTEKDLKFVRYFADRCV